MKRHSRGDTPLAPPGLVTLGVLAALLAGLMAISARPVTAEVVIHLNTGGMVKGELVEENDEEVKVRTGAGLVTTIFREDIERIERGSSAADLFREKLAKIAKDDSRALYELATWAKKLRLDAETREALDLTIAADPGHISARRELGHVLRDGRWVSAEEAAAIDAALGLFVPAAASATEEEAALDAPPTTTVPASASYRSIPESRKKAVRTILKETRDANAAKRQAAHERLLGLEATERDALVARVFADGTDDAARAARSHAARPALKGKPALETLLVKVEADPSTLSSDERTAVETAVSDLVRIEVREARAQGLVAQETLFRTQLERDSKKLGSAIPEYGKRQKEARAEKLAAWEAATEVALKTIFDKTIYPDENHGAVGQKIVDEKVAVVKEKWAPYDTLVKHDIAKFQGLPDDKAKAFQAGLDRARAILVETQASLKALGQEPRPLPDAAPAAHRALLLYRAGEIERAYALLEEEKEYVSPWERRLIERLRDLKVEAYNAALCSDTKPLDVGKRPGGDELKQVAITNAYRMMQGRHALEIHPCLVESARGHSEEMTRLGYFAHESPVPENREPSDRARNAKYDGGVAENISMGSVTPQATHDAWYNSSGHHRNILDNGHQCMGSGLNGSHWTQNFGSRATFPR